LIHVVDYGLGNVGAFLTVYKRLDIPAVAATTPAELADADHILLPGVGSFDYAMQLLNASGMRETLDRLVVENEVPVLGVCVGMQILGDRSDEGHDTGLGWISGSIRDLAGRGRGHNRFPLPHMGWNDVQPRGHTALLAGIPDPRFYFLHSFYFDNNDEADTAATAEYGDRFTCMVNRGNVWGVQFHPESILTEHGHAMLRNFLEQRA